MTTPSSAPMPHLDGVRHRDVIVNGFRMHVAETGEGPPVLLVHGWPQHWYAWRKVIPLLSSERRVLCPDLRGFGWSEAPPGRYDKQRLADDLAALLDALELESVDLVAHDWGAWAGFLLALDHPRRIRRYLALNMYPPVAPPPSPRVALALARLWYQAALAAPGLGRALIRRTDFVQRVLTTARVQPDVWRPEDVASFVEVVREPPAPRPRWRCTAPSSWASARPTRPAPGVGAGSRCPRSCCTARATRPSSTACCAASRPGPTTSGSSCAPTPGTSSPRSCPWWSQTAPARCSAALRDELHAGSVAQVTDGGPREEEGSPMRTSPRRIAAAAITVVAVVGAFASTASADRIAVTTSVSIPAPYNQTALLSQRMVDGSKGPVLLQVHNRIECLRGSVRRSGYPASCQ